MTFLFKGGIENEVKVRCRERSSLLGGLLIEKQPS